MSRYVQENKHKNARSVRSGISGNYGKTRLLHFHNLTADPDRDKNSQILLGGKLLAPYHHNLCRSLWEIRDPPLKLIQLKNLLL